MGYTHYLNDQREITTNEFDEIKKFTQLLIIESEKMNIKLCNGFGEKNTKPLIEEDIIVFNGFEEDSHETCSIKKEAESFSFCKTACKPYDVFVVAIYYKLDQMNIATMSSDGTKEELKEGLNLTNKINKKL